MQSSSRTLAISSASASFNPLSIDVVALFRRPSSQLSSPSSGPGVDAAIDEVVVAVPEVVGVN